ncbi:glycosyltransferase family 2 protein [Clostridium baratii]|uniref:Glycosyl transferase n=1 Tax=Clostridium baratii TaxID=1561 RepID=A0A174SM12_9CLOT|nr:glycosyltransferase [Clostridium baratii]CUP97411.1 glycosyl transferase [Clostridium baratii]
MISVIIPVYNVEKYLEKCINSVLNQTYKDLEIILVDDGSTDNSGKICDKYKLLDSRIKVIHKENGGLSDARNHGLDIASGEYIAFLDSDDWIDKNLYYILYKLSKDHNTDITVCNFKKVYTEDEKLNLKSNNLITYTSLEALEALYNKNYIQMIVAWNKLYKRSLFKENKYPCGKIHEDEFLTPVLLNESKKIVYIDTELIYYRQRSESIMNSSFNVKRLDLLDALEFRINYYKNNNLFELYDKEKKRLANSIIYFYYLVKKSDLQNKKNIIKKLREKFEKIDLDYNKSIKHSIKIYLFKYSPYVYVNVIDLKTKFKCYEKK